MCHSFHTLGSFLNFTHGFLTNSAWISWRNLKLNRFKTEVIVVLYSLSLEKAIFSIQSQRLETPEYPQILPPTLLPYQLLYNRNSSPSNLRMLFFFHLIGTMANVNVPPFSGFWPRQVGKTLSFLSHPVSSGKKVCIQVFYFGTCFQTVVSQTQCPQLLKTNCAYLYPTANLVMPLFVA